MKQKGSKNFSKTLRNPFLILAAVGAIYSLLRSFSLFTERINLFNAEEFSNSVVSLIGRIALCLFLLLIIGTYIRERIQKRGDPGTATRQNAELNRLFKFSWVSMLLILICSTVLIVIVNPRGLYGVSLFPQLHDNIRQEKVGYYLNLPEVPEMVIIGTSAALSISPEYIENTLGYNTFNFGISGPELDDSLLITRFIFDHSDSQNPKLILFQARGLARIDPKRMAQVSPLLFIPYMEPELRMLAFEIRFQELFNIHQLSEAIYVLQAIQNYEELPSYWSVTPNGFTEFHPPFTLEEDINKYLASGRPEISCRDENIMRGKIYLREIVSIAEENDAAIILFYNPIHPFFYQQYFENNPKSVRCFNIGKEFLLSLEAEYKHVFFEDFTRIESINGFTDETGFYDRQHMTPLNAELLVDALADTIQEAYQITAVEDK